MNTAEFIKRRSRIKTAYGMPAKKRKAAMQHLVREAGAILVVIDRKVVGWRMRNGDMVCMKRRHKDEASALAELQRITSSNQYGRVPARAYACAYCGGWHLTSQAAKWDTVMPSDAA